VSPDRTTGGPDTGAGHLAVDPEARPSETAALIHEPPVAVRADGVSKVYGEGTTHEVVALDDVSISVREGEVVALLGPSGCGKSTLLKMIGGLLPPSAGKIELDGVEVVGPSALTGFMFQRPVLFPWLTVLDNILLPVRIRGGKRNAHRDTAMELIELVGLAGFEDRYPWQLSGGMQQRVAICRMLINEPRLLLLDEPFGALDEMTREHMNVELRRIINQKDRSAVLVTHNPLEAAFVADRVVVLSPRPGRVVGEVDIPLGRQRPRTLFSWQGHFRSFRAFEQPP
jgi:NitT/TauT family transport system ATP-binding protein